MTTEIAPSPYARCRDCGRVRLDEVGLCPGCWSEAATRVPMHEMTGTISSYTRIHPRGRPPYWLISVALVNGEKFLGPIEGSDQPVIGTPVRLGRPSDDLRDVCEIAAVATNAVVKS